MAFIADLRGVRGGSTSLCAPKYLFLDAGMCNGGEFSATEQDLGWGIRLYCCHCLSPPTWAYPGDIDPGVRWG